MKQTIFIAALAISLGGIAQANSLAEKTGVNAVLDISPSTPDFVRDAAIGGMFEIQSSELAKTRAGGALAAFAGTMIEDHNKASDELKTLIRNGSAKETLPSALDDAHQKKLDELKALSGAEFARTYVDDQVSAHKDAVSLFERYAKGGDNASLKAWASKALPTLKHHLGMAEALSKDNSATQ